MLIETPITVSISIHVDAHGVIRVDGTRVPLQNIVNLFNRNESPEQIHNAFSTVRLETIYAIISYYLGHREIVDSYIAEQRALDETTQREYLAQHPELIGLTERLRERIAARTLET